MRKPTTKTRHIHKPIAFLLVVLMALPSFTSTTLGLDAASMHINAFYEHEIQSIEHEIQLMAEASVPIPTLSLNTGKWTIPSSESQMDLIIHTNQPFENLSVRSNNPSWLTVSGTGNTRTLHAAAHYNNTSRSAAIIVSAAGLTRIVEVTQLAPGYIVPGFGANEDSMTLSDDIFGAEPFAATHPTIIHPPTDDMEFPLADLEIRWLNVKFFELRDAFKKQS